MDYGDNKHCVETPWSKRYHYKLCKDGTKSACGVQDGATRVSVFPPGNRYPQFDFEIPRQSYELDKLEQMLRRAYDEGQKDAKLAIGKMMRDLIAL
jgi:hypothetical protein